MGVMNNAASRGINEIAGTTPDVSGAMQDYFQPMQFTGVKKEMVGFQVLEIANPINFRGTIQPFTERALLLKPEGQRAWSWFLIHSDISLALNVDDVVLWKGKQTRIMARKDYTTYGYLEYHCCQDWTGMGPE